MSSARRSASAGLALAAVLASTSLATTTAMAAPSDYTVAERPSSSVTTDVLPTTQIDGIAWDQKIVGNKVFVGGEFATARPAGAAPGTSTTPRANMLAYDLTTGELDNSFVADTNARVNVLALSPDRSRLYIGGAFTTVNGKNRYRIAAINTADGSLVSSFAPSIDASVNAIVVTDQAVYVGGVFSRAGGQSRTRLAAFSPVDGSLLGWAPTANRNVRAMTTTPDQSRIVIGGQFDTVNGALARGTASLDAGSGQMYPFALNQVVVNGTDNTGIYSLNTDGKKIIATAFNYGEGKYEGIAMTDPYSGAIDWLADCHGDTYDATVLGNQVYSVSHHHNCENIGSFPQIDNVTFQRADAFSYDAVGTVRKNLQTGYSNFAGQSAPSHVNWYPQLAPGTLSGMQQAAWTAESTDRYLVLGGEFPQVNGIGQQGLVRFAVPGTAPSKDGPVAGGIELKPRATVRGTSAILTWQSSWDRDNKALDYLVYRDDVQIGKVSADSLWWDRPTLSFTDDAMVAGRTHSYWLVAVDADGNRRRGDSLAVTAGPAAAEPSPYLDAVATDAPSHQWRLGEPAGATQLADQVGGMPLKPSTGVTLAQSGAVAGDSAARFSGTSTGQAIGQLAETVPAYHTAEAWVKTTTTSGGVIMNFGNSTTSTLSTSHDRDVYMLNSGQIAFGVTSGGARRGIAGSKAYNDGRWHHVAAALTGTGMKLYVDGELVASNAAITNATSFKGVWHLGGDSTYGLLSAPLSRYFNGAIDEAAVYPRALDAASIRAHAAAGGAAVNNTAPTAAFTVSCDTDGLCRVDGTGSKDAESGIKTWAWTFGDGSTGTGMVATHQYARGGAQSITLTVTDDMGASATTTQQVQVDVANKAPVGSFTVQATGLDIAVDAGASSDDGTITAQSWDFGDGSTGTGALATHSYAQAGTYPVTLTLTDDAGLESTITKQVTVLADGVVVGQDGFVGNRTQWGAAEVGGGWAYVTGGTRFTTVDGVGRMTLPAGGTANASLPGATGQQTTTTADVTIDRATTGGGVNVMLAGRRVGTSDYRAKLRLLSDGTARIGISRVVNGTETVLKEGVVAGGYTPGASLHVKLALSGTDATTIVAKAWSGEGEPAGITAVDATAALQTAGAAGVVGYASGTANNAPFTIDVDNLLVTRQG